MSSDQSPPAASASAASAPGAPKKRTLKQVLPRAGLLYTHHFADHDTADAVLAALLSASSLPSADSLTPAAADALLAPVFHRASERVNILPRIGHYKFWPTAVYASVAWFRAHPEGLGPNKFRLLATYLMQARLRPLNRAGSGPAGEDGGELSATAQAIDGYLALLRMMGLERYVPDPANRNWDRSTYHFRPDLALSGTERERLAADVRTAAAAAETGGGGGVSGAGVGSVFTASGADETKRFRDAFGSGGALGKRKGGVGEDEEIDGVDMGEGDVEMSGVEGGRAVKKQAVGEKGEEMTGVATKVVTEEKEVVELVETMKQVSFTGEGEGEDEDMDEEEGEDDEGKTEENDPFPGEDIYGLDD